MTKAFGLPIHRAAHLATNSAVLLYNHAGLPIEIHLSARKYDQLRELPEAIYFILRGVQLTGVMKPDPREVFVAPPPEINVDLDLRSMAWRMRRGG